VSQIRQGPDERYIWIPQLLFLRLPDDTPRSLRLYDDDIVKRRYAVGYVNSHFTPTRERLFGLLRKRLGDDQVFAGGKCNGEGYPINTRLPGSVYDLLKSSKMALVAENSPHDGYVTEKLLNGFLSGAVPIQFGSKAAIVEDLKVRP
jgi:hypothetical protein